MLQRFFIVIAKGKKGKHHDIPYLQLTTDNNEKLIVHLESASDLDNYQIDDEFAVVIGGGNSKQSKLPGAQ